MDDKTRADLINSSQKTDGGTFVPGLKIRSSAEEDTPIPPAAASLNSFADDEDDLPSLKKQDDEGFAPPPTNQTPIPEKLPENPPKVKQRIRTPQIHLHTPSVQETPPAPSNAPAPAPVPVPANVPPPPPPEDEIPALKSDPELIPKASAPRKPSQEKNSPEKAKKPSRTDHPENRGKEPFSFAEFIRKTVHFALKTAIIPLALAGLYICFDFRTVTGLFLLETQTSSLVQESVYRKHIPTASRALCFLFGDKPKEVRLSASDALRAERMREIFTKAPEKRTPAEVWNRKLFAESSSDPSICAAYASVLAKKLGALESKLSADERKEQTDEFEKVVRQGKSIDPDNALYDYLEAFVYSAQGLFYENNKYRLRDKNAMERGMNCFLAGLTKPFSKTHALTETKKMIALLGPEDDFLSRMEKRTLRQNDEAPYLEIFPALAARTVFQAELYRKNAKLTRAAAFTNAWRNFLPQMMKDRKPSIQEVLMYGNCVEIWQNAAEKRINISDTAQLSGIRDIFSIWQTRNPPPAVDESGSISVLSGLFKKDAGKNIFGVILPEKQFFFTILDRAALSALILFLTFWIVLYILGMLKNTIIGERPALIVPEWQNCIQIFLFGIIVPLTAFIVFTHVAAWNGRTADSAADPRYNLVAWGFLILGVPFIYTIFASNGLRKRAFQLGFHCGTLLPATQAMNKLLMWTLLLFVLGSVLKPVLDVEFQAWMRKDVLLNKSTGDTVREEKAAAELSSKMLLSIEKR